MSSVVPERSVSISAVSVVNGVQITFDRIGLSGPE